jgi:putative NIF3 family GTP cyclohydrolase 1 type 2
MNTEEIMKLSLKLAGLEEIPEDSIIYVKGSGIRRVLFGIDAGVSELLLARSLGYDCVIAHHPVGGTAIIYFHKVFKRHVKQMVAAGVPEEVAENAVKKKLADLEVDSHSRNYDHAVDVARLLKMPYMNIHTPLDEIGRRIMTEKISRRINNNSKVKNVIAALKELPEFKKAPENQAGKVVVSHGAGTNGGFEIARIYFKHGVGTVVYIHVGLGDLEKLKAEGIGNLVVTGHIASDSVGINPFIHELEKQGIAATTIGVVKA